MSALPYIAVLCLIALSAFFNASEIAFSSASRTRLKMAAENGGRAAKTALYVYEHFENALSAILIGNNLVSIGASSIATIIAMNALAKIMNPEYAALIAAGIMTVLILVFGEIAPKITAKHRSEQTAKLVSVPLSVFMVLFFPIIYVVKLIVKGVSRLWGAGKGNEEQVTEGDLVSMIETVEDEGVIDEDRSELLQSALEFSEISAQEILTPRVDMLAIDITDPMESIKQIALSSSHSRLPVYRKTPDNIEGILVLNHFFEALIEKGSDVNISEMLLPPCYIHKSMKLPAVLSELKRRQTHIAIVTDEYGGTMGVVTMEDVLEQLVGDIWDESDEIEDDITKIGEDCFEVSADMNLSDLFDELDVADPTSDTDYSTVGGFVIEMLKGFPNEGDKFTWGELEFTVLKVDDLRVVKVAVRREHRDPGSEDHG